ncbi:MAG: hypothetical protein J1F31_00400 [Erysipelotrichales bacterium]|nr:hypothetical protein [Erysipelotrichales bacterium]
MKKETKRKVVVVAGALALIAAVGTTAGTTFAKYANSASKDATSATVAKWGFTVSATGQLFGKMYGTDTKITTVDGSAVIASAGDYNVVAPGSSGSITFTINGTAEVNARIKVEVAAEDADDNKGKFQDISLTKAESEQGAKDNWTYNPIKWTMTANGSTAAAPVANNLVESNLRSWNNSIDYKANGTRVDLTYTLSWEWKFEDGKNDAEKAEINEKDTILGTMSHNNKTTDGLYTAVTTLKIPQIKVSVEQINTVVD